MSAGSCAPHFGRVRSTHPRSSHSVADPGRRPRLRGRAMSDAYPYNGRLGLFIDKMLIPARNYCGICHRDPCTSWCAKVRAVSRANTDLRCPLCSESVGINSWGNLECRSCTRQFSTEHYHLSVDGKKYPLRERSGRQRPFVRAVLVPAKGIGRFPLDEHINRLIEKFGCGR